MRTVPDARQIREWLERGSEFLAGMSAYSSYQVKRPKVRAVVVGGGFIGLEMAENLVAPRPRGHLVEMLDQVMAPIDPENAPGSSKRT